MQPQTTLVSIGTQTAKVEEVKTTKIKGKIQDREENEKKQVSLIYPSERKWSVARGAEEQPHNLLPLQEAPTGKNNQSIKIHKPFSYPEVQQIKRDLGD